ncbi:unnamed protein product, partial [Iphiclides podalirius]
MCYTSILAFVVGDSLENLQKTYTGYVMECARYHPITAEDIAQLQKRVLPDKDSIKCLFACAYKKAGMMDDEGKMSVEGSQEIIQKYLADDPNTLKKANDFTNACKSVNDETVSDGTRGCDRAALMFHCSIEKANEGLTELEIKKEFIKTVMKCNTENPVEMTELFQLQALKVPKKKQTKCLLACAYKKVKTNPASKPDLVHQYLCEVDV